MKQKLYTNGSVYFGEIQEEKRVGKGAYLFDSEDLYVGDWCDNVMSGNGIYVFITLNLDSYSKPTMSNQKKSNKKVGISEDQREK